MLNGYVLQSPDQKTALLERWGVHSTQWIVSDLESKMWLKDNLAESRSEVLPSDNVLRASELWSKLLFRLDPTWRSIPPNFANLLVQKWLEEYSREKKWNHNPGDAQRLFNLMKQILPLLAHFSGEEAILQWFEEKPEAGERLRSWYDLSQAIWLRFVQNKVFPEDWMKSLLLDQDLPLDPEKNLVFDLGLQLDDIEAELILNLSRQIDVHLLVPEVALESEIYQDLLSRCQPIREEFSGQNRSFEFIKLPTMLSEVKWAVAKIRQWADQGLDLSSVAVVSPEIETYWPTLFEFLDQEGIPTDKHRASPLSQKPIFQKWLAKIRLALKENKSGDGEQLYFSSQSQPTFPFELFKQLFTNVYEVEDYLRLADAAGEMPSFVNGETQVSLADFLNWSTSLIESRYWNELVEACEPLDDVFNLSEKLSYQQWLKLFETYFSQNEWVLQEAQDGGVKVLSLEAAQDSHFDRLIFLGLNEKNMEENLDTPLQWGDIESIKYLFGFNLTHRDRDLKRSKIKWLQKKQFDQAFFIYSESDFQGQFQAPSLFWLEGALEKESELDMQSPLSTRWDEVNHWQLAANDKSVLHDRLETDLGRKQVEPVAYPKPTVSASSFENFIKCPFKYYAEKSLGLKSNPDLDLDLDNMSKGRLLHQICEIVVRDSLWSKSDLDVEKLVHRARRESEIEVYSDELWSFEKNYYIEMTKAFIHFEKAWRQDFPDTQSVALEQRIKTHLSVENGQLVFSDEKGMPFRGSIDRIDKDSEDHYLVIDYKTSGSQIRQFSSWLKKGSVQMFLYSLALKKGLFENQSRDVVGAHYFVLKDTNRTKGFHIAGLPQSFLPEGKSKDNREKWEEFLNEGEQMVAQLLGKIEQGVFGPEPEEESHCESCQWKQICRYQNLNQ